MSMSMYELLCLIVNVTSKVQQDQELRRQILRYIFLVSNVEFIHVLVLLRCLI